MQTLGEQDFDEEQVAEIIPDAGKPEQIVKIGASLAPNVREQVIKFLTTNVDYFAWSHEDVTGIYLDVITHKLNVDPHYKTVKQRRRKFADDHQEISQ